MDIYVERVLNGAEKDCPQLDLMRDWGKLNNEGLRDF
jgi:hypothetical protein